MSIFLFDIIPMRGIILKIGGGMEKLKRYGWVFVVVMLGVAGGYAIARAEWDSSGSSSSDSYTLKRIENHLENISEELKELNRILRDIKDEINNR